MTLQIKRSGALLSYESDEIELARKQFQERFHIRVPRLLESGLLEELHKEVNSANWEVRVHEGIGVEYCLADKGLTGLINFLINDQRLFRFVEEITGCESIGCFAGRVYRMFPNSGHYDSWHSDMGDHRLVALTINLSEKAYSGGLLEIAPINLEEPSEQIANTGFGDAVLFRLSSNLKHRVTKITGTNPKTAFAGWFKSQPNLFSMLSEKITS